MLKHAKLSSICQNTKVTEEISFSWRAKAALEITTLTILPLHILPSKYLQLVKVKAILNGKAHSSFPLHFHVPSTRINDNDNDNDLEVAHPRSGSSST